MAFRGPDGRGRGRGGYRGQARGGRGGFNPDGAQNQFGYQRGGGNRGNFDGAQAGRGRGGRGGRGYDAGNNAGNDAAAGVAGPAAGPNNGQPNNVQNGAAQPRQRYPMGFPRIDALYEDSPENALMAIASSEDFRLRLNWDNYRSSTPQPFKPAMPCSILRIIRKALECNQITYGGNVQNLLRVQLLPSEFLRTYLPAQVMSYPQTHANTALPLSSKTAVEENFRSVLHIMHEILQRVPDDKSKLSGLYGVVAMTFGAFQTAKASFVCDDQSETATAFACLQERWNDLTKMEQERLPPPTEGRKQRVTQADAKPPNDFREISCFPTTADFIDLVPFLRPNKVNGSYTDAEHYLDVQFRLLREDFIAPIREGVLAYKETLTGHQRNNRQHDVRIYHDTWINPSSAVANTGVIVHKIQFDIRPFARINWEKSKRFLYGSLVCLSQDDFTTMLFATVHDRNATDLLKGIITVQFETPLFGGGQRWRLNAAFVMVESPGYFEAYRHVLKALQQTDVRGFPMERYLIRCEPLVNPPAYALLPNTTFSFECLGLPGRFLRVNLLNADEWPSAAQLKLDESQYAALQLALTKELALIQGPPGTGKTFIGYKIAQFLLANQASWTANVPRNRVPMRNARGVVNDDVAVSSPILVICYTNHALDQFLEGILQFLSDGIIRVGGRCQNPALDDFALEKVAREKASAMPRELRNANYQVLQEIGETLRELSWKSKFLEKSHSELVSYFDLAQYMDPVSRNAFAPDAAKKPSRGINQMRDWLLQDMITQGLAPPVRRQSPTLQHDGAAVAGADDEPDDGGEEEEFDVAEEEARRRENADALDADFLGAAAQANGNNDPEDGWFDAAEELEEEEVWERVGRPNNITKEALAALIQRLVQDNNAMTDAQANVAGVYVRDLRVEDRWQLYRNWLHHYQEDLTTQLDTLQGRHALCLRRKQEINQRSRLEVLKKAKVIGMTTTGAARHQGLLMDIKPRIVIIEEAAEVLEAHIVASLTVGCQHLILIGDHHQLRPSPAVYTLAIKYNLEISLFERLLKNNLAYACLRYQHRMRIEIASTLMPHFYDNLQNHESVFAYEPIKGVKANMFFIDHREKEQSEADSKSKKNPFEAKLLVGLARYLLQQGYNPQQITILSAYMGQVFLIRNELKKSNHELLGKIKTIAVDNFQGEENDIILLSLVRSNDIDKIGFLNIKNRICVALSRAKMGFYCVGNFEQMQACSTKERQAPWRQICESLTAASAIGRALTVACQRHQNEAQIEKAADFQTLVPDGGCKMMCDSRLSCGHPCKRHCHADDLMHDKTKCTEVCGKKCAADAHNCNKICLKCKDGCGPCKVTIDKLLACGHTAKDFCYLEPSQISCKEPCPKTLTCGHRCQNFCSGPCTTRCQIMVDKQRSCGHIARTACSVSPEEKLCKTKVEKLFPACEHRNLVECRVDVRLIECPRPCGADLACKHPCVGTCGGCRNGRLHQRCEEPCTRILICGHKCKVMCSAACPPCPVECLNRCNHSRCAPRPCGQTCPPCMADCGWSCEHSKCKDRCHEPCAREPCNLPCKKIIGTLKLSNRKRTVKCEHECLGLCGEPCPKICDICTPDKFEEILAISGEANFDRDAMRLIQLQDCPHIFLVSDMDAWMSLKSDTSDDNALDEAPSEAQAQEFALKVCMLCRTQIRRSYRYGHQIKQSLADVEKIKTKIRGGCSKDFAPQKTEVLASLEHVDKTWREADVKRDTKAPNWLDWTSTMKNLAAMLEETHNKDVTRDRLDTVQGVGMFLTRLGELSDTFHNILLPLFTATSADHFSTPRLQQRFPHLIVLFRFWLETFTPFNFELGFAVIAERYLQAEFRSCFQWLNKNMRRCSEQMLLEFECELRRFEYLITMFVLFARMIARTTPMDLSREDVTQFKRDLLPWLYGSLPITPELCENLSAAFKQLQATYSVFYEPVAERERIAIIKAVGLSASHWFKCPKGHLYAIGECGGAMQRSVCPECKSDIGGEHHTLDRSNRPAVADVQQYV